ncbi:PhzF family phenazine biosynthesis protein [soil metagenome]
MTRSLRFRIVNVFAESTLGGNPLCVFENGLDLADAEMLALARQFNLSETTLVLPPIGGDARVRIFTPSYEMPFAGHPSLGTGYVVGQMLGVAGRAVLLDMKAGQVRVDADGDRMTLTAPREREPRVRPVEMADADVAALLGLRADELAASPAWVDSGADQMIVPVDSAAAVLRAKPDAALLDRWPLSSLKRRSAYVVHVGEGAVLDVTARYFFTTSGGGVTEDPGTGSACANLGAWLAHRGRPLPFRAAVAQGDQIDRPCRLTLEVTADRAIRVGGRVIELAHGELTLP